MRTVRLKARITANHELHCTLPEDLPAGPAEVIVRVEDGGPRPRGASLQDFMRRVDEDPIEILSKEEIDAYIEAERASWE